MHLMTRLLHFTDMHLRWHQPGTAASPLRLSRDMPATLDRLAGRVRALAPDVLVMSGDILDMPDEVIAGGTPDDLPHEEWMDHAVADFRLVRDWFEATGVPFVVVPGNHDHEARSRRFLAIRRRRATSRACGFSVFGTNWRRIASRNAPAGGKPCFGMR